MFDLNQSLLGPKTCVDQIYLETHYFFIHILLALIWHYVVLHEKRLLMHRKVKSVCPLNFKRNVTF